MTAIFGAPARAHLYATLAQLLQLPGKPGLAADTATASFDAHAEGWDVFTAVCATTARRASSCSG